MRGPASFASPHQSAVDLLPPLVFVTGRPVVGVVPMTLQYHEDRTEDGYWRQQKHQHSYVVSTNEAFVVGTRQHGLPHRTLRQRNASGASEYTQAQNERCYCAS